MHKRIGILGGMSPESTVEYYQYITRTYTQRFGDYGYPDIIIYSVSFQPYVDWPNEDRWDLVGQGLSQAAQRLEAAGADFIVIATNTMHLVLDQVRASIHVPVLSLLDVVGEAVLAKGLKTVGLLGTRFTMEKNLYQDALAHKPRINSFVVQSVTYTPETRDKVLKVCSEGGLLANEQERETQKVLACAPLIFFFYYYGQQNSAPESVGVARQLYWYAMTDKSDNSKKVLTDLLRSWGIQ